MSTVTRSADNAGRNVFLLHGWGGTFDQTWRRTGWDERLKGAGYSVHGPQLLGHGVPDGPHDPAAYACIADLLESELEGVTGAIGIGYSLGAKMFLELSCRNPRTFSALVLIGLGANTFKPLGASAVLADTLRNGLKPDAPDALRRLIASVIESGNDPLAMAACISRPQDSPITPDRLKVVTCPVLLLNGSEDHFILPVEPLIDALPNVSSELLSGLDHLDLVNDAGVVDETLSFLARSAAAQVRP